MSESRPQRRPIAVVLSRFPTVTETFILREFVEMEAQGQPVRLVPMIKESPPVLHDAAKPWTARALYTKFLSPSILAANLAALARHPLRYFGLLARLILGTIDRPVVLAATLALFPKSIYLARELEREGIRHLHVHWASHPATLALIVSKFSNITYSITVHAHDIQVFRNLLDWKIDEARFVRTCTEFNRKLLEKLYPHETRGKMIVIHYGVEPDLYVDNTLRMPNKVPTVLCVASHRPYKGLPYLIEACRMLRDEGVQFVCNLVGTGPMRVELEQMIRDRNLGDVVQLLGARPEAEVARLTKESDLFVLPSIIQKDGMMEGMPNALIEAMAGGRPVISTTIAGIPELIEEGKTGFLVPPESARALADAMRKLIEDPERARQMGERGRERIRREFDIHDIVAQLVARLDQEAATQEAS
ncbi:MAG: glycosyltransferase family 4 protein [Acidobacteria bacterium]|nr:glycosyltransferase family 4 protein [Acidobacteriota bacterium]MBV9478289.1 glycosyltransferase family 4 protein [Acidobacteriota bacterium]